MKSLIPVLLLAACGAPDLDPIDNSLLASVSEAERQQIAAERADRDRAADAHAIAQRETQNAEQRVELAQASLKTLRASLDESKLSIDVARNSGTAAEVEQAEVAHRFALARAEQAREEVALGKRQLEAARMLEKLRFEEHRLSMARVELTKAEALQDVDLEEARSIPVEDYRNQVSYHEEETETARGRYESAQRRVDEAQEAMDIARRRAESLDPGHP